MGEGKKKGSYSKGEATPLLYSNFVDVFISPKFELVSALATIVVTKDIGFLISEALLNIFEIYSDQTFELMKWAVQHEMEQASSVTSLFRGASFSARLMSTFYKKVGAGYLKQVLGPWLLDLTDKPRSYEIDPLKALPTDTLEDNFKRLNDIAEQILDRILNSVEQLPVSIRLLLSIAKEKVAQKYPEATHPVIAGSIFLRYICPAIIAPTEHGLLLDTPGTDIRRALILVSKLLQNLANEQFFEKKEEFMLPFNSFITNNMPRLREFFSQITQSPRRESNPTAKLFALPSEEVLIDNIGILYAITSEHRDKIAKFIECNYPVNFASLFISKLDEALAITGTLRKKGRAGIFSRVGKGRTQNAHAHAADEEGFRTLPRKSLQDFQRELQAQQQQESSHPFVLERRHSSAEADAIEQQFMTQVEQFVNYFGLKLKEKDKQLQEVFDSPSGSPRTPRDNAIPRSVSAENIFFAQSSPRDPFRDARESPRDPFRDSPRDSPREPDVLRLRSENADLLRQVRALTEENSKLRELLQQQTNGKDQPTTHDLVVQTRTDIERITAILAREEERKQRKRNAREARRAKRDEGAKEGERDALVGSRDEVKEEPKLNPETTAV